jgi:putative transposase
MKQIVAELEIHRVIFTKPRRPEGHGKIEAFNRFIRSAFLAELKASNITTLDELNEAFLAWADLEYNSKVHGETQEKPINRWRKAAEKKRFAEEEQLRQAFLWKETRTTDKAGLLSLLGIRYQVGPLLAKKKVQVRFDPEAPFSKESESLDQGLFCLH